MLGVQAPFVSIMYLRVSLLLRLIKRMPMQLLALLAATATSPTGWIHVVRKDLAYLAAHAVAFQQPMTGMRGSNSCLKAPPKSAVFSNNLRWKVQFQSFRSGLPLNKLQMQLTTIIVLRAMSGSNLNKLLRCTIFEPTM